MSLKISRRIPTLDEFKELRQLAGWPLPDDALIVKGLSNSLYGVVIHTDGGELQGMGRIVGDDAIYFHIQDVIVRPHVQRQGIGTAIMDELMAYLENKGGSQTNIGLMCSKGRENFYKQYGFVERPSEKFGAGMIIIKP